MGYCGLWVFVSIYGLRLKSPNKVISLMWIFVQRPTISEIHWFVFRRMVLVYRINCCNSIFLVIFSVAWSPYVVKWRWWCLKSALLNATEHKTLKQRHFNVNATYWHCIYVDVMVCYTCFCAWWKMPHVPFNWSEFWSGVYLYISGTYSINM